ncbi:hypothetical protein [Haloarcula japonica]|uniref:Uncharacterized protein n=1 Tax=Haloarcula japonica (strain ATCC 49778 / DSM 6131 / JCM 7785 / NBRC 101032 / NCIMB 13157 / TR-1) TaxID=1227453 RepID=M0LEB0_HALJT|nr:hypothetical protein [Haloarcula japonica]EMA30310.1 hypothetical protein C444_10519 [Haloarcula japonica DSM 6131]
MPSQTDDVEVSEDRPDVAALDSGADRTVFTEDGNRDGWISTDVTVDLRR